MLHQAGGNTKGCASPRVPEPRFSDTDGRVREENVYARGAGSGVNVLRHEALKETAELLLPGPARVPQAALHYRRQQPMHGGAHRGTRRIAAPRRSRTTAAAAKRWATMAAADVPWHLKRMPVGKQYLGAGQWRN